MRFSDLGMRISDLGVFLPCVEIRHWIDSRASILSSGKRVSVCLEVMLSSYPFKTSLPQRKISF